MAGTTLGTKYKLNENIKKGENKIVYLNGYPIAYLKKHGLSTKTETEDLATKFSGTSDDKMGGKSSYSISIDALVSNNKGHMSVEILRHYQFSGLEQDMEICWSSVAVGTDGTKQIVKGNIVCKGKVIVTEVGEESEKGNYETVSVNLEGSGPLLDANGNEYGSKTALDAIPALLRGSATSSSPTGASTTSSPSGSGGSL